MEDNPDKGINFTTIFYSLLFSPILIFKVLNDVPIILSGEETSNYLKWLVLTKPAIDWGGGKRYRTHIQTASNLWQAILWEQ